MFVLFLLFVISLLKFAHVLDSLVPRLLELYSKLVVFLLCLAFLLSQKVLKVVLEALQFALLLQICLFQLASESHGFRLEVFNLCLKVLLNLGGVLLEKLVFGAPVFIVPLCLLEGLLQLEAVVLLLSLYLVEQILIGSLKLLIIQFDFVFFALYCIQFVFKGSDYLLLIRLKVSILLELVLELLGIKRSLLIGQRNQLFTLADLAEQLFFF